MHRLAKFAKGGALAAICLTATGTDASARPIDLAVELAAIEQFQSIDQRLQDIGWKLVRSNAEFCQQTIPSVGLQLQDLAIYGKPDIARAALKMRGDFAIQTAASGSPADSTGAFARNREVTRLGAIDPNTWAVDRKKRWLRLTRAHDTVDEILNRDGALSLTFADGQSARVRPVTVCAARFELIAQSDEARSKGVRVQVGIENKALTFPEDEFAALIAHELAHTVLDHTAWRERNGRGRKNIRLTEREADRLMPWLLANAGYDPHAAARFFEKFRPPSGSVLFFRGSHDKWRNRVALVNAEIPLVEALMATEGKADWSTHFRREVDPARGLERVTRD